VRAVEDREEDVSPELGVLGEEAAADSRMDDQLPDRPVGAEADAVDVPESGRVKGLLAVQVQVVQAFARVPVALLGDEDRQDRVTRLIEGIHSLVARDDGHLVFDGSAAEQDGHSRIGHSARYSSYRSGRSFSNNTTSPVRTIPFSASRPSFRFLAEVIRSAANPPESSPSRMAAVWRVPPGSRNRRCRPPSLRTSRSRRLARPRVRPCRRDQDLAAGLECRQGIERVGRTDRIGV